MYPSRIEPSAKDRANLRFVEKSYYTDKTAGDQVEFVSVVLPRRERARRGSFFHKRRF